MIEKKINRYVEVRVEKVVEKPVHVERIVERPKIVDKVVEVPVETVRENIITVDKVIDKPVYIDAVMEKEVEHIVIKDVQVPVEKEIKVEILHKQSVPRVNEHESVNYTNYETDVQEFHDEFVQEEVVEVEDEEFRREIQKRQQEVQEAELQNRRYKQEFETLTQEFTRFRQAGSSVEESENIRLKARLSELSATLRSLSEHKSRLHTKSVNRSRVVETQIHKDPRFEQIRSKLRALIAENHMLIENMKKVSSDVSAAIQKSGVQLNALGASNNFSFSSSHVTEHRSSSVGRPLAIGAGPSHLTSVTAAYTAPGALSHSTVISNVGKVSTTSKSSTSTTVPAGWTQSHTSHTQYRQGYLG